jgi:hypothetical protein
MLSILFLEVFSGCVRINSLRPALFLIEKEDQINPALRK